MEATGGRAWSRARARTVHLAALLHDNC